MVEGTKVVVAPGGTPSTASVMSALAALFDVARFNPYVTVPPAEAEIVLDGVIVPVIASAAAGATPR